MHGSRGRRRRLAKARRVEEKRGLRTPRGKRQPQPGDVAHRWYPCEDFDFSGLDFAVIDAAKKAPVVVVESVTEVFNRLVREAADQQVARRTPTPKLSAREKYLRRQGRKA